MLPTFWKSKNFRIIRCHPSPHPLLKHQNTIFFGKFNLYYITYTLSTWTGCSFPLFPHFIQIIPLESVVFRFGFVLFVGVLFLWCSLFVYSGSTVLFLTFHILVIPLSPLGLVLGPCALKGGFGTVSVMFSAEKWSHLFSSQHPCYCIFIRWQKSRIFRMTAGAAIKCYWRNM